MISEIDFVAPCPVEGCKNNSKKYRWTHYNCGGYEKITNQGIIYCCKCDRGGLFTDWKFNCGAHVFKYASAQGYCNAFSVISQLDTKNKLFIAKLMKKVGEQFLTKNRRDDGDDGDDEDDEDDGDDGDGDSEIDCRIY